MYAFYSTLAIGGTVMMCMFAAMLSTKMEANRAAAPSALTGDWEI